MLITLEDSIEIKTTPEKVFEWLIQLRHKEAYQAWHPDHVDIHWIKGEPFQIGSIVYFEEYLHGRLHKVKFLCTKIVPNREIEYRPLFPWSIFTPKSSFVMEPKGKKSCIFTATSYLRLGPLFLKIAKKRLDATMKHIKEEGENLKRILEKVQ